MDAHPHRSDSATMAIAGGKLEAVLDRESPNAPYLIKAVR